jgi:hypothetical protein
VPNTKCVSFLAEHVGFHVRCSLLLSKLKMLKLVILLNATINENPLNSSLVQVWGFHSSAIQDSSLLGCNVASLGKWLVFMD